MLFFLQSGYVEFASLVAFTASLPPKEEKNATFDVRPSGGVGGCRDEKHARLRRLGKEMAYNAE